MNKAKNRYYSAKNPGSYGGVFPLARESGVDKNKIKNWLRFQDTYTLHVPVRSKFPRRQVIVSGPKQQYQTDLVDVHAIKKENDNYTFLLTCIDVFSRYAYVIKLRNKTSSEIIRAFGIIFEEGGLPHAIQSDKGSEFTNRPFQNYLKKQNIRHFTSENDDIKCAIVERFNRTLKERLWRIFTHKSSRRYVEILPDVVASYNNSYHNSIKMRPSDVNKSNQEDIWHVLYSQKKLCKPPALKIGDSVRISQTRVVFKKGYLPKWTEEIFTISKILKTSPVTYRIKDYNNEELSGSFYAQELQQVGPKTVFAIEAVLKRNKNKVYVKWAGYPASFNSWIPAKSLQKKK